MSGITITIPGVAYDECLDLSATNMPAEIGLPRPIARRVGKGYRYTYENITREQAEEVAAWLIDAGEGWLSNSDPEYEKTERARYRTLIKTGQRLREEIIEQRIQQAESSIREHGFSLHYVEFCEDAETPGLIGCYAGVTSHEKKKVKVKTHRVSRSELADVLEHELHHVVDPLWDCGSRDVFGNESPAAVRRREAGLDVKARVVQVEDQGMWRGKHSWQITMEDDKGRARVQAYGDNEAEAIAHATETFADRRIFTDEERAALGQSSAALRKWTQGKRSR